MRHYKHLLGAMLLATVYAMASPAPGGAEQNSGWRLLQGATPAGSAPPSMSHTSDMMRSDLDLAGLMLRCHDPKTESTGMQAQGTAPTGGGAEVAIVVVTPFPPRAVPSVTIGAAGKEWHFEAHVVPPGAELLLPAEAAKLAAGQWQSIHELTVRVSWQERSFGGIIPIDGLADALATLTTTCPAG
jgi:hypothetical protein